MSEEVSINSGRWEKFVFLVFFGVDVDSPMVFGSSPKNVTCLEHETIYMYTSRMKKDGHFCRMLVCDREQSFVGQLWWFEKRHSFVTCLPQNL